MSTVFPAESLPRWSRYAAMLRDCGHEGNGAGDGILWSGELQDYIDRLEDEASTLRAHGRSTAAVEMRLSESEQMLKDMRDAGADGLDYLPPQLRDAQLPPNLVARAVELLMHDDRENDGKITSTIIGRAKRRYASSARTAGSLRNQGAALTEIKELADALGL